MAYIFKPNDRVRRGKTGPLMRVQGYDTAGKVVCSWYEPGAGWKRQAFEEKSLRRPRVGWRPK